jgi:two-component system NarL family response regulator
MGDTPHGDAPDPPLWWETQQFPITDGRFAAAAGRRADMNQLSGNPGTSTGGEHHRIGIIVVDDHGLVRDGLRGFLNQQPDFTVLEVAGHADEGIVKVLAHRPDIVLMDIDMPGASCFDAVRMIRARAPDTRCILLSAFINDNHIEDAVNARVHGFLDKTDGHQAIAQAIRKVHAGGNCFSPSILERLVISDGGIRLGTPSSPQLNRLSPRERELLRVLGQGVSLKDAAGILGISYKTADKQKSSVMVKLDIHDKVELAHFAIREGLVKP